MLASRNLWLLALCWLSGNVARAESTSADWPVVGGTAGGVRYSDLRQLNRSNVARVEKAWEFHTGEAENGVGPTIECTPIVVDGQMFVTTGERVLVALDPATGEERWRFDPAELDPWPYAPTSGGVNRGCAYWTDGSPNGERRVLHGVSDGRLFSVDARTGKLDHAFGDRGVVDLRAGLDPEVQQLGYGPTSAPAIWQDTIVLGFSCGEGPMIAAPGDVRAFDVRTGKERWRFRTVPKPGEFGADTWESGSWRRRGGANAWSGFTVDERRGWVFAGTGSAAFDFYGGDRRGANLFANCTLALDARTGERVWHFQTVHHDLLDHDTPAPPVLVSVTREGRSIEAVAQVTKTGYVYLFDRATGEPLFDVVETAVPSSDVPGEEAWPTQPIPTKPPALVPTSFDEQRLTNIAPANRASAAAQLEGVRYGGAFTPPSLNGTVVMPGFHGGANWSGASFDPEQGLLFVNVTNCPNILQLVQRGDEPNRYGPYGHTGYRQFRDHEGYPAIQPPWGELIAVDLAEGEIAWRSILGEYPELTARGVPVTGTESFGGSIVTAGGLVFIGGTKDERFRAFDSSNGEVLWSRNLPAGGYATPCTYEVGGRQYVVIAAGGAGKQRTRAGDSFVAFALP